MLALFYFLAIIVVWLGILSLRSGISFARYVARETTRVFPQFSPFASLIAPCRGLDDGLRENVAALFEQDYPAYELIFVSDRADDRALGIIEGITNSGSFSAQVSTRVVIAGEAVDSGQKVHNLKVAVAKVNPRSEVLVFVDTDARPQPGWLRSLVAPLADEEVGAATGYRWFLPASGGLASHLRSVWNASIASALGERHDRNFCWGGSTAIRRSTFDELQIAERWRGTVSDDFTMTRALQEANLPIQFVPACLIASLDRCTAKELLEFTNRQLKITRVYAAHLWKPVLVGSLLFTLVFFGGIAFVLVRAIRGLPYAMPLAILAMIYALGTAKSYIRLRAVSIPLSRYSRQLSASLLPHLLLWPITSALYLYNALAATSSRRIRWRGITYELKSPTEAVIISREQ
jgi:cellulose synthase/poly-beta-1,6-N-acetylglucosamine synthase-like glycosyltransferase